MCRKLICLTLFAFVLGLTLTSPARAALVAWWRFDDGSGTTAADASGNGNDGTLVGGTQWVAGQLGGAIQFNGTDSYVRATHIPLNNRSFTITMWVNPVLYTDQQVIFGEHQSGSQNLSMHFRIGGPGGTAPAPGAIRMGFYSNDLDSPAGLIQDNNWYHLTFWYDFPNQTRRIYVNAVQKAEDHGPPFLGSSGDVHIGQWNGNQWFRGMIDDVQIYDTPLTQAEIDLAMQGLKGYPYPSRPDPADGAQHADTWVTLSWKPGDFAVSHDVYLGDDFDDVNAATHDSNAFRGNQTGAYYVAGFPGYAYPDGLVPGTTYYWRVDEVNDADPNSPWRGPVWSFSVPPKKAYNPQPADGAKFIDPNKATLSWTAGFGAKLHTVYFGDDLNTVTNATGGVSQALTTYSPGVLEAGKTYYWRVDEFDAVNTYKGDVWSFTTAKIGGGVKGQYFKGMNFDTFVLSRIDPQINFNWGDPGGPDPAVGVDNFSARWTGEVEAAFTETYTFYTTSDDGVRLWIDGQLLVDNWTNHASTENSGKIDLVAGQSYSLQMEYYENTGGAVAELSWSSPHTPKQIIPQAALSPPVKANNPKPVNGATGTSLQPVLTWNPGDFAASHDVYFGTDANAVSSATKTSPEYKGSKNLGDESYSPGKLDWFTTYYWRVDEVNNVNPDSPWVGHLWSFTTGDFLLIDDFESYNSGDNQIWYAWHDGLGYGAAGTADYFAGNGTGSAVGDETTNSYTEETIVHGGRQSMPLSYDNNKQGFAKYSETEFKLTYPRDWTEQSVGELSLWFRGRAGSVGSFVEAPAGTYTMTATGADIWNQADQFHFAYKTLTGAATIQAKVLSVGNTDPWAKAGVMIRETLDAGSRFAAVYITPGNGCRFQARLDADAAATSDSGVVTTEQTAITAPYWVKLQRDFAGNFTGYYSSNGTTWTPMTWNPQNITMGSNIYIGLALTAHNANATCTAQFSNVTMTGTVGAQWADQDIGIASNAPEPLYVAISNAGGQPAVVTNPDPNAATTTTWTQWVIPLSQFSDQGINLTNVDTLAIGLGTRGNTTVPGGSGKMYFDDIRLYRPTATP
jgi:PA14 domain/Concanavalin A-like lectin/glucanases superfamily